MDIHPETANELNYLQRSWTVSNRRKGFCRPVPHHSAT